MNYTQEEIKKKVKVAIGVLWKNDSFLLKNDVNERSISHKFAEYLQQQFPEYHVDCEYNKQVDQYDELTKKEVLFNKEEEEKYFPKTIDIRDTNSHTVYPDIIIHIRGSKENNLLAIEVKKNSNSEILSQVKDYVKLKKFMEQLSYPLSCFVGFGRNQKESIPEFFVESAELGSRIDKLLGKVQGNRTRSNQTVGK